MEYLGYMAPVAFVFAISAVSQISSLKKEVGKLKAEIEELKQYIQQG